MEKKTKNKILLNYNLKFSNMTDVRIFVEVKSLYGFKLHEIRENSNKHFKITFSVVNVNLALRKSLALLHSLENHLKEIRENKKGNYNVKRAVPSMLEDIKLVQTDIKRLEELKEKQR